MDGWMDGWFDAKGTSLQHRAESNARHSSDAEYGGERELCPFKRSKSLLMCQGPMG